MSANRGSQGITRRMYEPAMEFAEIAAALGITPSGAWMLYQNAIRKLRRDPQAIAVLAAYAAQVRRVRESAEITEVQR
jgi:hypothetical protein